MRKKSKTFFMETTTINPPQTVGEIQQILGQYGASQIMMEYDNGEVTGVFFNIRHGKQDVPFRLPCRWEKIKEKLDGRRHRNRGMQTRGRKPWDSTQQAKRIAWRQILRWIESQLAFVDSGNAELLEVFTPYLLMDKRMTLYEKMRDTQFQLEHKK